MGPSERGNLTAHALQRLDPSARREQLRILARQSRLLGRESLTIRRVLVSELYSLSRSARRGAWILEEKRIINDKSDLYSRNS